VDGGNVGKILKIADGAIVGTSFKQDGIFMELAQRS